MGIILKPTKEEDYEEYYRIRCIKADIFWNGYEKEPDKEEFRNIFMSRLGDSEFAKPEDRRIFLIQNESDNVGFVQLIKREDGIDIGYTVTEEYQRRGYAAEALKKAIELARLLDKRIYVQIRDDNIASQGVALKCGFIRTEEYETKNYPQAGEQKLRKYRLVCFLNKVY